MKWVPKLEADLEEMLVRNQFDFIGAAKEFQRYLNSNELSSPTNNTFYKIDAKTLQLKWTDIEIRKHVIPTLNKEEDQEDELSDEDQNEGDELPPLEQPSQEELRQEKQVQQLEQAIDRQTNSSSPE